MSDHIEFGKNGEELAQAFLRNLGYDILELNWKFGKNEIDIIAAKDDLIVIVEVKTRKSNFFGEPEVSVTKSKQRILVRAANAFLRKNKISLETRFDVISIILTPHNHQIKHIEDAFYPIL
ncbi:MAG: YraN family protein [Bacteroidales bacterium]|nr:YraN family protein [Bacteroidales bacterium]